MNELTQFLMHSEMLIICGMNDPTLVQNCCVHSWTLCFGKPHRTGKDPGKGNTAAGWGYQLVIASQTDEGPPIWRAGRDTHLFLLLLLFFFFRAAPAAYGSSQAEDLIGAAAAGLHHSHSNMGSEPHLQPTPQLTTARSLTHWARPGIELASSWILVRFVTTEP